MSNKSRGNELERDVAEYLYAHGFWVHRLQQNADGQPADIIAVNNGKAVLIDCKQCDRRVFRKSRIEENQQQAMKLWEETGNGEGWFAVRFGDEGVVYMVSSQTFDRAEQECMNQDWFEHTCADIGIWMEAWRDVVNARYHF